MHEIIKVDDVAQEYRIIAEIECDGCKKKGVIKRTLQRLIFKDNVPYDELECVCTSCGKNYLFTFDVSECFKKYSE
jgi:hypothetical protein